MKPQPYLKDRGDQRAGAIIEGPLRFDRPDRTVSVGMQDSQVRRMRSVDRRSLYTFNDVAEGRRRARRICQLRNSAGTAGLKMICRLDIHAIALEKWIREPVLLLLTVRFVASAQGWTSIEIQQRAPES